MAEESAAAGSFEIAKGHVQIDVPVDEALKDAARDIERSKAALKRAGDRAGKAAGEGVKEGMRKPVKEAGKGTEQELSRMAKRANASFDALKFGAAFAGLPLAAGAASALAVGSLAAIPLAVGVGAAVMLAKNEDVAASYHQLADTAVEEMTGASMILADTMVSATRRVEQGLRDLPLHEVFADARPAIDGVVDGTLALAQNAMPGLRRSLRETEHAGAGLELFLGRTGTGLSDFFDGITAGAPEAGRAMGEFGSITRDVLGFTGRLVGTLSKQAPDALSSFQGPLGSVLGLLETGASDVLPSAIDGVEAFADGVGGLAAAATPLISALGQSGLLGPLAQLYAQFKLLDMITGGRLLGSMASLDNRIKATGKSADTFGAKMGTLVSRGGALGVGLMGVSLAFEVLNEIQNDSAIAASSNQTAFEAMAQAHVDGSDAAKRAATDQIASTIMLNDGTKSLQQIMRETGISTEQFSAAIHGGAEEQQAFVTALAYAEEALELNEGKIALSQDQYDELAAALAGAADGTRKAGDAERERTATLNMQNEALQRTVEQTMSLVNANLAYRQSLNGVEDAEIALQKAQSDANKVLKEKGKSSKEYTVALETVESAELNVESAQMRSAEAARQNGLATSKSTTEAGKAADADRAWAQEIGRLVAASNGSLTPALLQSIGQMNATSRAAAGVTVSVNNAGQAVLRLPGGKTIVIRGKDEASALIRSIDNQQIRNKYFTIKGIYDPATGAGAGRPGGRVPMSHDGGYNPHFASSGPAPRHRQQGGMTPVLAGLSNATVYGETGMELGFPSRSEYVSTALQTAKMARELSTANAASTAIVQRDAPSVQGDTHITVNATLPALPDWVLGDLDTLAEKIGRVLARQIKGM